MSRSHHLVNAVLQVAAPEQAREYVRPQQLEALLAGGRPELPELPGNWPAWGQEVSRVYLGSEFCDRLLPPIDLLRRVVCWAREVGVALTLATPIVSDGGLRLLRRCLRELPAGSEVVVNDWGVLHVLRRDHPVLRPLAGRAICKAIKDPRLPSATWARLYPPSFGSTRHSSMLARRGFVGVQLDVAPFARPRDLQVPDLPVAVNVGIGYVTKGRMCRFGSLDQDPERKFAAGHACRFECHDYVAEQRREGPRAVGDLATFQRGNTVHYVHSGAMTRALAEAVQLGFVHRLVYPGEAHADRRADQPS